MDCQPRPEQIQPNIDSFNVLGLKRCFELVENSVNSMMVVGESPARFRHHLLAGSRSLKLNCFGKQNVILEMNMLMKITLQSFQRLIQSLVTDANICRYGIVAGHSTQFAQEFAYRIVLH